MGDLKIGDLVIGNRAIRDRPFDRPITRSPDR
jgi:hypothetical protein